MIIPQFYAFPISVARERGRFNRGQSTVSNYSVESQCQTKQLFKDNRNAAYGMPVEFDLEIVGRDSYFKLMMR
ncbi:MAG: hypothetical protein SGI77_16365 [Pirellulaceae bacterium]|nr:hypothetical protein [Pirellulaceae bacterium]